MSFEGVKGAGKQPIADKGIESADGDGKPNAGCIKLSLNNFGHYHSSVTLKLDLSQAASAAYGDQFCKRGLRNTSLILSIHRRGAESAEKINP